MTGAAAAVDRDPGPAWRDACIAAACIAIDPVGLGGIRVRSAAGPVRDAWSRLWRSLVPAGAPIRAIPLSVDEGRLFGGLDLAASLRSGRAVHLPGVLAEADGGYAVLAMAERVDPATAARIADAIESGRTGTRFGVIAFDEGDPDEALADTLAERLGLCIDLRSIAPYAVARGDASNPDAFASITTARSRLPEVTIADDLVAALCSAALVLGIGSMRVPLFAIRAARAHAAWRGRTAVATEDAAIAVRLVYASRARQLPPVDAPEPEQQEERTDAQPADAEGEQSNPSEADADTDQDRADEDPERALDDVVLEAAVAAIPAALLDSLASGAARSRSASARGGAGARGAGRRRGAPAGVRRGRPRSPERLSLIETLRAAAPWQRIRRAEAANPARGSPHAPTRVHVRVEDLHVVRFQQRHPTTTVFVVDASGSSALHRLAEAKGAVELLLADCYVRRDNVAVLAFRGKGVELLLPPTRSLVRARRSLARLPGGGGTPLAGALDATRELVVALRRRGDTALVVLLTDGRANIARDGSPGRPQAEVDAFSSARSLRAIGVDAVLIDTSPKPHPHAAQLAVEMGARYRPLPHADARAMSTVVNRAVRERAA